MKLIQNFDALATTPERKIILEVIEAGLEAIQPDKILQDSVKLSDSILTIQDKSFTLSDYQNLYLVGFGKGSAGISKIIEKTLGESLTEGYVIDTSPEKFTKIQLTQGTHPLPSQENFEFTKKIIEKFSHLTEKDLVLIVICGGGSAMFVAPNDKVTLEQKIEVNKALLKSGATIHEMNMVRKHLSKVKGGGLAKLLHPATIVSLIFSDVPGNDLNVIASGPTVKDPTTIKNAQEIIQKYKIKLKPTFFIETPKDDMFFKKVSNILMVSNVTALKAMEKKALESGYKPFIYSDKFQGNAPFVGKELTHITGKKQILLAGGETTVKVKGNGKGGRNQVVVLGELLRIDERTTIASVDSDGWDNTEFAGAIGDNTTLQKAQELNIHPQEFLQNDNSYDFFDTVKDGIITGRLPSNVADLFIVLKN